MNDPVSVVHGDQRPAIQVDDLVVAAGFGAAQKTLLHGVSLSIPRGKVTCLVGESGSGKTMLVKTVLGLLSLRPGPLAGTIRARTRDGSVVSLLNGLAPEPDGQGGKQLPAAWYRTWQQRLQPLWGAEWGFVAQHGTRALDPTRPAGDALLEALARRHGSRRSRKAWKEEACMWLDRLRFDQPERVLDLYPRQLSGGMAQRFVIAVALARGARVLFADEPTTGLDPDAQEALIDTLLDLRSQGRLETLILVTHDLALADRLADQVAVMHQGMIQEASGRGAFFGMPGPRSDHGATLLHEFRGLNRSTRRPPRADGTSPRLTVRAVEKHYTHRKHWWSRRERKQVLAHVDLDVHPGEIVGLVGPSGSGKTTLARVIGRLTAPDRGLVSLNGKVLTALQGQALRRERRNFQVLFQQVAAAIHPRMRVEEALRETAVHVLGLDEDAASRAVEQALRRFHLEHCRTQFPAELSGGECRRVGLARAMMVQPLLLIADEPTAGIDAALRNALLERFGEFVNHASRPSVLIISHDRRVMAQVADRVMRLEHGSLVATNALGEAAGTETRSGDTTPETQRGCA